ncbi:glycosyltransferase family 4 protein [Nocardioides sp.]|uniref:glycosyltransferase family 4 protein n=1 Tax=Nocardioides sp. TaxID=35761 RepID=UPI00262CD4ED|nr:glycosyltransferase family 4 protein [Nocardioides sp.]
MSTLLVAHPSAELYGSDRQLAETVAGAVERGWDVVVVLPSTGALVAVLEEAGAQVRVLPTPVLRHAVLSPRGAVGLALALPGFVRRAIGVIREVQPDEVLVNTVTIPWWLAVARSQGRSTVCHVHEAEDAVPRWVRFGLALPLLLADRVVANSQSSQDVLVRAMRPLRRRARVVYNGVPAPERVTPPRRRRAEDPLEVVLVGRLSPRKGTDVALEAVSLLRARGTDARLRLCGSVFEGYEWFEDELRTRAAEPDLAGAVEFCGYVEDPAAVVAAADAVLVPSRMEPFGNTAVEALLAERPLVASRVQGLAEIVEDHVTGLLVEPGDAALLAQGLQVLAQDPDAAARMASRGRHDAERRFSLDRYREEMAEVLAGSAAAQRHRGAA